MVEGLATGASRELYRRSLPGAGQPGFAPQVQWAKLLSGRMLWRWSTIHLYLWDLPAARLVYRIERVGGTSPPALSPGGRYLAVPAAGGATIIETATGQLCGSVTMGGALKPGWHFTPTGSSCAVCREPLPGLGLCGGAVVHEATTTDQLGCASAALDRAEDVPYPTGQPDPRRPRHVRLEVHDPSASEPLVLGDKLLLATSSPNAASWPSRLPHGPAQAALKGWRPLAIRHVGSPRIGGRRVDRDDRRWR
jgi:hypothetical protein